MFTNKQEKKDFIQISIIATIIISLGIAVSLMTDAYGQIIDYESFMNPDGSVNLTKACSEYVIMPGEKTAQGLTQCLPYLNNANGTK